MINRNLVDPELRGALELFPSFDFSPETLAIIRQSSEAILSMPGVADAVAAAEDRRIPGPAGAPDVRVLIYRPVEASTSPRPAILHIHGGGFVIGGPEMTALTHQDLVKRFDCVIVSVDYRLAPETSYPGPIEDCYAALKWLHAEADSLGVDPDRIGVSGESAGGGLAAALALLARDRGEIPLAFQHLTYPMLDDRTCVTVDPHQYAGVHVWTPASNIFGWTSLLGKTPGGPDVEPYASPARAKNLSGLPQTYIAIGALDLFLDENMDYALRLTRAGVPVEFHVYPGAYHGFQMAAEARITGIANRDSLDALGRFLFAKAA